jgi:hypothetical protein
LAKAKNFPPPPSEDRVCALEMPTPVATLAGPGRWLVLEFAPVSLFSLKASFATSSVAKSLVLPTPYAIKMALIDVAFRIRMSDEECAVFCTSLRPVQVRIRTPHAAVVTHTFVKVRQEPKDRKKAATPYGSSIAYREMVSHAGTWQWAFDLAAGDDLLAERLVRTGPHVNYVGKRGSFVQYLGMLRQTTLDLRFTTPVDTSKDLALPPRLHFVPLDDFGPNATLEVLSTFSPRKVRRDEHRRFVSTLVPIEVVRTGPGFTEYVAGAKES